MINVVINGEKSQLLKEQSLADAIGHWGYDEGPFAVAVNETFVPRHERESRTLQDGDRIDIVAPIQGG